MARDAVEIETGRAPTGAVIWLHGLGADGHDFEPIVPELVRPGERALRFVFPHAPLRPVTLNGGYAMRAWYDIIALDRTAREDEAGIRASQALIEALIRREKERGIASERIVLAGFSQGGALALFAGARHARPLAGIMGLSCYLLLAGTFAAERRAENARDAHLPRARPAGSGRGARARRGGAAPARGGRLCGGMAYLQHASLGVPAGGRGHRRVAARVPCPEHPANAARLPAGQPRSQRTAARAALAPAVLRAAIGALATVTLLGARARCPAHRAGRLAMPRGAAASRRVRGAARRT